jgi:hypothetical protein
MPPEGSLQLGAPPAFAEVRDSLANRRGYRWVNAMFARHRNKDASRFGSGSAGEVTTTIT